MATISVSLPSDGSTADVSDHNTPINTIVNEINGNLDNSTIKAGAAIATSKLADDAGITNAKIAADTITGAKINWASTGADAGIWWEELGRTTLSSAADSISVASLPARRHLRIIVTVFDTGGTVATQLRFNNDTGNNYAYRSSANGAADGTTGSTSHFNTSGVVAAPAQLIVDVYNIATDEKVGGWTAVSASTAGAANAPTRVEGAGKWANTSDQITRVDLVNVGTGDYAIGSTVVVLGHD